MWYDVGGLYLLDVMVKMAKEWGSMVTASPTFLELIKLIS